MKPQTIQISERYSASACAPNTNFNQSKAGSCDGDAPVIIHTIPIVMYPMPAIQSMECFFPIVTALSPTDIRPHPLTFWATKKKTVCVIGERRRCEIRTSHLSSLYAVFFLRKVYLRRNICYLGIWGCQFATFYTLAGSTCRSCHLFATYLPLFFKPFFSKTPCQKGFARARLPLCHFLCHFLLCVISWRLGAGNCHFGPIYLYIYFLTIK